MIDLSDEEQAVREVARTFARERVAPRAAEWNRTGTVPLDALREMADLGFLGVVTPQEYGGADLGLTGLCLISEALAGADLGLTAGFDTQTSLGTAPLARFGSEEQKRRYLAAAGAGEIFISYGLSEPDHGSDAAALETVARETSSGWSISGSKLWITNGGFADLFILFARTDGAGARGVSAFLVERADGVTSGREIAKLGLHSSSTVELSFEDVEIPADRMLGPRGDGMKIAFSTLDSGRVVVASQAVGIAQAALDLAVEYAGQRQAFGGPIARLQGVQFPIAEVAAKLDAARLLTYQAARTRDRGEPVTALGAKAKLFASAVAVEAADVAVQTLGGFGYSAEFPAERYYRDARITQIYEGTSEIQRVVIARSLFGDDAR